MCIDIRQTETDEEFKQYLHLRWKLLRAPWKQAEGSEIDDIENQCNHFIAYDKDIDAIIAVARLQFNSELTGQIRYMAVTPTHERRGIGRQLINAIEHYASTKNSQQIVLDAREPAVDFYLKLGYTIIEKTYILFDEIQHYRMKKTL